MTTRTQATRFDVLEAQTKRRQDRRDLIILAPVAIVCAITIAVAFAGFFTTAL